MLVVTRLDRLGRTTLDTLRTFQRLDEAGFRIKALDLDIDTATPAGRLVATTIISLAQWEVDLLRERTKEGIENARRHNVRIGRPPKVSLADQKKIVKLIADGGFTTNEVAKHYRVSPSTIERIKAKHRDQN